MERSVAVAAHLLLIFFSNITTCQTKRKFFQAVKFNMHEGRVVVIVLMFILDTNNHINTSVLQCWPLIICCCKGKFISFNSWRGWGNSYWSALSTSLVFPQQRSLMGSSTQNSSGAGAGSGRFRRRSGTSFSTGFQRRFRRRCRRLWCRARSSSTSSGQGSEVQSPVRFNTVPEKVPRYGRLWCRARSSSTGFQK